MKQEMKQQIKFRNSKALFILSVALVAAISGCSKDSGSGAGDSGVIPGSVPGPVGPGGKQIPTWDARTPVTIDTDSGERVLTLLATNDIHGGIELAPGTQDKKMGGGSALLSGALKAIRQGLKTKYGDRSGTLTLDGGDQFQGKLISNFDEGQLTISTLSIAGYDAAVPGNHDYDFGPIGWLADKVVPGTTSNDTREAFKRVISQASFPFISANTYMKASLRTFDGKSIPSTQIDSAGCTVRDAQGNAVDAPGIMWGAADRPDFLVPYIIKHTGGLRVALIGLDREDTPLITTPQNVSDLCFRDTVESYNEIRDELEGQADVFVMVIHNGAPMTSDIVSAITSRGTNRLHAVIAGHTHRVESSFPNQVPVMQSGANGEAFGQISLVWNDKTKSIVPEKTRVAAGIRLLSTECDKIASQFCKVQLGADGKPTGVSLDDVPVLADEAVKGLIATARVGIADLASKPMFIAKAPLKKDRILESPLGNLLTDEMRIAGGGDLAFINTGGIRQDLDAGTVTYEQFYSVQPFNNHALKLGPLAAPDLIKLLTRSIQTCGSYGALMQSGLKIKFEKNCSGANGGMVDPNGRLTHVELLDGTVLLDTATGVVPDPAKTFTVITLDFLASGGDGFGDFSKAPLIQDLGIFRELLVSSVFGKDPLPEFDAKTDRRFDWTNMPHATPSSAPSAAPSAVPSSVPSSSPSPAVSLSPIAGQ